MNQKRMKIAIEANERVLRNVAEFNRKHDPELTPRQTRLIEALMKRRGELQHVYLEVYAQLDGDVLLERFWAAPLACGAYWQRSAIHEKRSQEVALRRANDGVAKHAEALAKCLRERSEIENRSGFTTDTCYHILDVVQQAGQSNGHFRSYVSEPLNELRDQYGLKYWPGIDECLEVIASDAGAARISPINSLLAVATHSSRSSLADFARVLILGLDEAAGSLSNGFPKHFRLTNESMATLINVLADPAPEEPIDGAYVKNLRHRARKRGGDASDVGRGGVGVRVRSGSHRIGCRQE